MLLTEAYYQAITADTATTGAIFASAASAAQDRLEEDLGRPGYLEDLGVDIVETCVLFDDGTVYPTATPITACTGLTVVDDTVYGATPDPQTFTGIFPQATPPTVDVTYRGGYTTATCPRTILDALAWATYTIAHSSDLADSAPEGATSVRVGDVAVTFGPDGRPNPATLDWPPGVRRYRAVTL